MKKFIYLLNLIVGFIILTACSKEILDLKPLDQFSDADFWKDPNLAVSAVNQLYTYTWPDGSFHDWEAYTPNAINGGTAWAPSHTYTQKGWTATDANFDRVWSMDVNPIHGYSWEDPTKTTWKVTYREIRDCNVVIQNLNNVPNRTEKLDILLAQARFMRAYLYHVLTRRYGAVILLDKPLGLNDDANLPRNTYKECVDFMVADLTFAESLLPKSWSGSDLGRATSGAAIALKGRILLYGERWADAAMEYQKIMDGTYSLFPDFQTLFFEENENNQEIVFDCQMKYPEFAFVGNAQCLSPSQNGWGAGNPTQNLVDKFELLDGKLWNDPTSVYYNPADPYANRDKRFYATIQHDQGVYFGKRLETGIGYDGNGQLIKGVDIAPTNFVTATCYYLCKGIDTRGELVYSWEGTQKSGTNIPIIRYAEVLLGYAEAQNEVSGPDATVYNAVNEVRSRAGLPSLPMGLSKDEMRQKIRTERQIELAFEYTFYFDCLRWKDRNLFTQDAMVANIQYEYYTDPVNGEVLTDETSRKLVKSRTFSYSSYFEKRVFNLDTDFDWFFPIPQDEIDRNSKLIQNGQFSGNAKQ